MGKATGKKSTAYSLVKGLLTAVAWLPLRGLYVGADLLYLLVYYVVRYRVKLVRRNLEA